MRTVVVKRPGHKAEVVEVNSKQLWSRTEDGYPNSTCFKHKTLVGWCDDDGIEKGLAVNFARPTDGAVIRGLVIITSMSTQKFEDEDGNAEYAKDWDGLTPEEVQEALDLMAILGVE